MLRALRRRLALLLALLSALVLTLVAAAGLWLSWQQQTRASDLVFRSRFAALCDQLAVADLVTDGWLAARQLELGGVLDLVDGGRPVHFSVRQRQDADLAALLDQAEGAALAAGLDPDAPAGEEPRQVDYTVTEPGGARWRGLAAVLPRGGGALRLTALQPLAPAGPGWRLTLLGYGGLWLAGLAGLAAVSWLGAGHSQIEFSFFIHIFLIYMNSQHICGKYTMAPIFLFLPHSALYGYGRLLYHRGSYMGGRLPGQPCF